MVPLCFVFCRLVLKARFVVEYHYPSIADHRVLFGVQTFGFDDDEDYEVDDGGDDGMLLHSGSLGFMQLQAFSREYISIPSLTICTFMEL